MARGHGRILTSIWEDADFLALDEREQRLYLFLISQPNLNHAGLLDLTLRRWARKARGLTSAELEKLLQALEAARFIVMDDDTEELLIRSFVRNDGVWRMPKVMGAMVSGALEISSKRLQYALLEEMDRIPLEELNDEPAKLRNGGEGPSIRRQVTDHIDTLRKAFGDLTPDPDGRGSVTPSDTPSATPSDTPDEGGPKGSTRGRAATHVRAAPAPAPTPTPDPSPVREGVGAAGDHSEASSSLEQQRPDGRPSLHEMPDDFELTDGMRKWSQQTFPRVDVDHETQKFIWHSQGEGTRRRNWYAAWQKWIAGANQHLLKHGQPSDLPVAAGAENVLHMPRRPSTADQRATAALAVAAELAAEENQ